MILEAHRRRRNIGDRAVGNSLFRTAGTGLVVDRVQGRTWMPLSFRSPARKVSHTYNLVEVFKSYARGT